MQWLIFMKLGMWVVLDTSVTHVCRHQIHILNSSFAYLFWLANNNKGKYPEFYVGYSDETWYVSRNALKYYQCVVLLSMRILSTSFAYSAKGGPPCLFCEYSKRVSREPQNSSLSSLPFMVAIPRLKRDLCYQFGGKYVDK